MQEDFPKRSGRNKGGYHGESIRLDPCLDELRKHSESLGWVSESLNMNAGHSLLYLERPAQIENAPRVFISAGIHGDEPATTAAIARLIQNDLLQRNCSFAAFPCLNPKGMRVSSRETPEGKDLNRDFLQAENRG